MSPERYILLTQRRRQFAKQFLTDWTHNKVKNPQLYLYGSTLSCTALSNGDVDYAISPCDDLKQIDRAEQADLLTNLYHHLTPKSENRGKLVVETRVAESSCHMKGSSESLESSRVNNLIESDRGCDTDTHHTQLQDTLTGTENCQREYLPLECMHRIFCARVPVLQYTPNPLKGLPADSSAVDKQSKLLPYDFDLTLSLYGVKNSLLLREYVRRFPIVRPLLLLIKLWGHTQNIIDSRNGWFSSYALTLMMIEFLQLSNRIAVINPRNVRIEPDPSKYDDWIEFQDNHVPNDIRLILQEFFQYYANQFDFDEHVVDVSGVDLEQNLEVGPSDPQCENRVGKKSIENSSTDVIAWRVTPEWIILHDSVDGNIYAPKRKERRAGVLEPYFTAEEEKSLTDEEKWHRVGHARIQIRDPYEAHSLGRSVEFFKAEAFRELLEQSIELTSERKEFTDFVTSRCLIPKTLLRSNRRTGIIF